MHGRNTYYDLLIDSHFVDNYVSKETEINKLIKESQDDKKRTSGVQT